MARSLVPTRPGPGPGVDLGQQTDPAEGPRELPKRPTFGLGGQNFRDTNEGVHLTTTVEPQGPQGPPGMARARKATDRGCGTTYVSRRDNTAPDQGDRTRRAPVE